MADSSKAHLRREARAITVLRWLMRSSKTADSSRLSTDQRLLVTFTRPSRTSQTLPIYLMDSHRAIAQRLASNRVQLLTQWQAVLKVYTSLI